MLIANLTATTAEIKAIFNMPFQKGHDLNKAGGGKRKNAGRKPDDIKLKFQEILYSSKAFERMQRILETTEDDEIFLKAFTLTVERGFGKVPQPLSGEDGGPLTIKLVQYA